MVNDYILRKPAAYLIKLSDGMIMKRLGKDKILSKMTIRYCTALCLELGLVTGKYVPGKRSIPLYLTDKGKEIKRLLTEIQSAFRYWEKETRQPHELETLGSNPST